MADFLTTLAGRTLGLMPETRPSLTPPFASETSSVLDLADEAAAPVPVSIAPPASGQAPAPTAPQPALRPASLVPPADLSVTKHAYPDQSRRNILPSSPRQDQPVAEPGLPVTAGPIQPSQPQLPPAEENLVDSVLPKIAADASLPDYESPSESTPISKHAAASPVEPLTRSKATQIIQPAPQPAPPALTGPGPKLSPMPEPPLISPASAEPPAVGESFSPPLVPPAVEPLATEPPAVPAPAPTGPRDRPVHTPPAVRPENSATAADRLPSLRPAESPAQPVTPTVRPDRASAEMAASVDPSPLVAPPATPATAMSAAKPVAPFPEPLPPIRPQLTPHRDKSSSPRNGDLTAERRQTRPEPPTIQVTIGRIEVRATPPPQPAALPPAPARPRPALSLDDYLAKRREVKR